MLEHGHSGWDEVTCRTRRKEIEQNFTSLLVYRELSSRLTDILNASESENKQKGQTVRAYSNDRLAHHLRVIDDIERREENSLSFPIFANLVQMRLQDSKNAFSVLEEITLSIGVRAHP
jgi:hypothetical protein